MGAKECPILVLHCEGRNTVHDDDVWALCKVSKVINSRWMDLRVCVCVRVKSDLEKPSRRGGNLSGMSECRFVTGIWLFLLPKRNQTLLFAQAKRLLAVETHNMCFNFHMPILRFPRNVEISSEITYFHACTNIIPFISISRAIANFLLIDQHMVYPPYSYGKRHMH